MSLLQDYWIMSQPGFFNYIINSSSVNYKTWTLDSSSVNYIINSSSVNYKTWTETSSEGTVPGTLPVAKLFTACLILDNAKLFRYIHVFNNLRCLFCSFLEGVVFIRVTKSICNALLKRFWVRIFNLLSRLNFNGLKVRFLDFRRTLVHFIVPPVDNGLGIFLQLSPPIIERSFRLLIEIKWFCGFIEISKEYDKKPDVRYNDSICLFPVHWSCKRERRFNLRYHSLLVFFCREAILALMFGRHFDLLNMTFLVDLDALLCCYRFFTWMIILSFGETV